MKKRTKPYKKLITLNQAIKGVVGQRKELTHDLPTKKVNTPITSDVTNIHLNQLLFV
jgi:hypothetical protein